MSLFLVFSTCWPHPCMFASSVSTLTSPLLFRWKKWRPLSLPPAVRLAASWVREPWCAGFSWACWRWGRGQPASLSWPSPPVRSPHAGPTPTVCSNKHHSVLLQCTFIVSNKHCSVHLLSATNTNMYTYSHQQTPQCTLTVSNKHHSVHLQSATDTAVYTYSQQQTPQCTVTVSNKHCSVHLQSATNTTVYSYSQQQTPQCTLTVHLQSATNTTVDTYSQQQTLLCTLTVSNKHCSVHLQSAKNSQCTLTLQPATNTTMYTYGQQHTPQCTHSQQQTP